MKKKNKNNTGKVTFESKEIKVKNIKSDDYKKITGFIIALVVIAICGVGLYFLNGKLITKDLVESETETTTTAVSYDASLLTVDSMLDEDGEYYVMVYSTKDEINGTFYTNLVSNYTEDDDSLALYSVDLSLKMNSSYYDTSKAESIKAGSFNFVKPTLVTVKKGKVKAYTTDTSEIVSLLSTSSSN